MKNLLGLCLVVLSTGMGLGVAAPPAALLNDAFDRTTPPLQKGIHVTLPVTHNAITVPAADETDAFVVAVTLDGRIFVRVERVTAAALSARLQADLSGAARRTLYVKADARTAFMNVATVLDATSAADIKSLILLTSQEAPHRPEARVFPEGLEVLVGPRSQYARNITTVTVRPPGQRWPELVVNDQQVSLDSLPGKLAGILQRQSHKVVLVSAHGKVPFAEVVHVADVCRSMNAAVVLLTPGA